MKFSIVPLITVKLLWYNLYCMKHYVKVTWLSKSSFIFMGALLQQ